MGPELSSASHFVEQAKAQRRINVLEKELLSRPPLEPPCQSEEALPCALTAFRWTLRAPRFVFKAIVFSLLWWLLNGSSAALTVEPALLWPIGGLIAKAKATAASAADGEHSEQPITISPLTVLMLVHFAVGRVRHEVVYWSSLKCLTHHREIEARPTDASTMKCERVDPNK